MPRYPILTPFRLKETVHKTGHIELDARTAAPYLQAGVIGPAVAELPQGDSNAGTGAEPDTGAPDSEGAGAGSNVATSDASTAPARPSSRPAQAGSQPRR